MIPGQTEALTRRLLQFILLRTEAAHIHSRFIGGKLCGRTMLVGRADQQRLQSARAAEAGVNIGRQLRAQLQLAVRTGVEHALVAPVAAVGTVRDRSLVGVGPLTAGADEVRVAGALLGEAADEGERADLLRAEQDADRPVGAAFFGHDRLMDFELMGGDARQAIIDQATRRNIPVNLPPLVPFGSRQWPTLITPGPGAKTLADLP